MRHLKRFATSVLIATTLTMANFVAPDARAGHERGNGIDVPESQGLRAWFPGLHRRIRYCTELDASVGVTQAELARMLEWAFTQWEDYLGSSGLKRDLDARFSGFGLATRPEPVACDGTEDLRFLIGKSNEAVDRSRAEFKAPLALAVRTSTDPATGWSKGWIWVSGDVKWGTLSALRGVLLHEIGHTFGFDHAPGTIMTSQFARFLEANPGAWSMDWETLGRCFTSIEHSRQLYVSSSRTLQYNGELAPDQTYGHRWDLFSMITGSVFAPTLVSQFSLKTSEDPDGSRKGVLLLRDSRDFYRAYLDLQSTAESVSVTLGEEPIFSASPEPGNPSKVFRYYDRATTIYGTMRVGKTDYDVLVEHNQNATSDAQPLFPVSDEPASGNRRRLTGPVRIKIRTTPGHWETLFVAKPFQ